MATTPVPMWRCPDGGWCHHACQLRCFRVLTCLPLTGEFVGDEWPEDVVVAHRDAPSR